MSLIDETKAELGYTVKVGTCENCAYCEEREDPHLDRSWHNYCIISNICQFEVEASATCNRYDPE